MSPRAAGLLLALSWLGLCSSVQAQAQAQAQARAEVVLVGETHGLASVLAGLAREIGVDIEAVQLDAIELRTILMVHAPEEAGLLARAWVRVGDDETLVVFSDSDGGHLLIRRIPTGPELDSVEIESLAQIVAGSLEALKLGGRIGVQRVVVERSLAPEEPVTPLAVAPQEPALEPAEARMPAPAPSTEPRATTVELEVLETLSVWSTSQRPQHRLSLRARLGSRSPAHPGVDFGLGYLVPTEVDDQEVTARLEGVALRLGASAQWLRGRGAFRVRVAGGVDLLHARARVRAGSSLTADGASWRAVGMLELSVGAAYAVLRRLSLFADVGLGFDLSHVAYLVEQSEGSDVLFSPLRVRPLLSLGLRVDLDAPTQGPALSPPETNSTARGRIPDRFSTSRATGRGRSGT